MAISFVKFQRGSQSAYNALKTAGRLEPDALYFIYNDPNDADAGGKLYLGERLIGGTGSTDVVSQLNDLTDVDLSGLSSLSAAERDGAILQFNNNTDAWEPVSIRTAIENSGASVGGGGASVSIATKPQNVDIDDFLDSIQNPHEGDIIFVDNVPYIYDGNDWQLLIGDDLESRVTSLETRMTNVQTRLVAAENGLAAVDGKISAAIAAANHLTYDIPAGGQLPEVTQENVGTLSNTVFLIPNGQNEGQDRYAEYMLINGTYEKLGNWGVDLSNYVTTNTFNTTVGNLQTALNTLQDTVDDLQDAVDAIDLTNYVTYDDLGSMSDLRTEVEDNSATVIGELLDLRARLAWNPIDSE